MTYDTTTDYIMYFSIHTLSYTIQGNVVVLCFDFVEGFVELVNVLVFVVLFRLHGCRTDFVMIW